MTPQPQILDLYHVIHATDELAPLDAWYDTVFGPRRQIMDDDYFAGANRQASLLGIADAIVEAMAPRRDVEGWERFPFGKFFNKFGRHWHSIAWYVDDVVAVWEHLRSKDLRVIGGGGPDGDEPPGEYTPIFTHPRDTMIQLQFMKRRHRRSAQDFKEPGEIDPRYLPGWDSSWWSRNHPLGIERLGPMTILTTDLESGVQLFTDVFGGTMVGERRTALTGTVDVEVAVGPQTVVQLSRPEGGPSLAAEDLEANGSTLHAVTFCVGDLAEAEAHLLGCGVKLVARDEETLLTDPQTCFGAPFRFTTRPLPGRADGVPEAS